MRSPAEARACQLRVSDKCLFYEGRLLLHGSTILCSYLEITLGEAANGDLEGSGVGVLAAGRRVAVRGKDLGDALGIDQAGKTEGKDSGLHRC